MACEPLARADTLLGVHSVLRRLLSLLAVFDRYLRYPGIYPAETVPDRHPRLGRCRQARLLYLCHGDREPAWLSGGDRYRGAVGARHRLLLDPAPHHLSVFR